MILPLLRFSLLTLACAFASVVLVIVASQRLSDAPVIAYSKDSPNGRDLYLLDMQTRLEVALTTDGSMNQRPHWSPDGERVLFFSDRRSPERVRERLYIMQADGTDERPLQPGLMATGAVVAAPVWSPDGNMIALKKQDPDNFQLQLWALDLSSGEVRQLTDSKYIYGATSLKWTPDSTRLRYVEILLDEYDALEVSVKPPAEPRRLHLWDTDFDDTTLFPVFSADASQFMIATRPLDRQDYELYAFDVQAGDVTQWQDLASTDERAFAWSPDGAYVAYTSFDQQAQRQTLHISAADGSHTRTVGTIESAGRIVANITASPNINWFTGLVWSSDGRWLGYQFVDGQDAGHVLFCTVRVDGSGRLCARGVIDAALQP